MPFSLGRHSYVGELTHISQNVHIGSFCSIGNLCTIGAQRHPYQYLTTFPFRKVLDQKPSSLTYLGSDVWVGSNVVIIEGVLVGVGAVIGAGSIVTKDIPPFAIVCGNPARVMKYRFSSEVMMGLLETCWWNEPLEVIKELPLLDAAKCVEMLRARNLTKSKDENISGH